VSTLVIREATLDDAEFLLAWRNDPDARANSLSSGEIDAATHMRWFSDRLADRSRCRIYVAEREGARVGQLRVDVSPEGHGVVSVTVAPDARGSGVGTELIRNGTLRAASDLALGRIDAIVKHGNTPSLRAFAAAGYGGDASPAADGLVMLSWRAPAEPQAR